MEKKIDVAEAINNPSALTQEQGDIIYQIICTAFDKEEPITLDFSNIESMISPFLNNAIGQLYGKYTSSDITKYLHLENFPQTKNATLNIVISNAKNFYANQTAFSQIAKEVLNIE
jgi:chemotaxis methyl-accepting protein methylase